MEASKIISDVAGKGFAPPLTISLNTAKNYLKEPEYIYRRVQKDVYVDGYEKEDVVAYQNIFLRRMSKLEHRMPVFSGDNMVAETWPDSNVQPLILVIHDKYIFSANDGSRYLWIPDGEQPLRKKDQGRSIHVSEFLTHGRLVLSDEMQPSDELPRKAYVIIYSDKN
ncbi:15970_t:CDS:2, partial [Racocetra fulgida]